MREQLPLNQHVIDRRGFEWVLQGEKKRSGYATLRGKLHN